MKVKKLSGSYKGVYEHIKEALGIEMFKDPVKNLSDEELRAECLKGVNIDIDRTRFIGSEDQYKTFKNTWGNPRTNDYTQGDMTGAGAVLTGMFIQKIVYPKQKENDNEWSDMTESQLTYSEAYVDDDDGVAGVTLFTLRNNPSFWMISVMTNADAKADDRNLSIYFSDLAAASFSALDTTDVTFYQDFHRAVHSESLAWLMHLVQEDSSVNLTLVDKLKDIVRPAQANTPKAVAYEQVRVSITAIANYAVELEEKGHQRDADIAKDLAECLESEADKFFKPQESQPAAACQDYKDRCFDLIKKAKPRLTHYEGWSKLLVNVLLAIVMGAGLLYAVAGAVKYSLTGNFFLYNPKSKSYKQMEEAEKIISRFKEGM